MEAEEKDGTWKRKQRMKVEAEDGSGSKDGRRKRKQMTKVEAEDKSSRKSRKQRAIAEPEDRRGSNGWNMEVEAKHNSGTGRWKWKQIL